MGVPLGAPRARPCVPRAYRPWVALAPSGCCILKSYHNPNAPLGDRMKYRPFHWLINRVRGKAPQKVRGATPF